MKNFMHTVLNMVIVGLVVITAVIGSVTIIEGSKPIPQYNKELRVDYDRNTKPSVIAGDPTKWIISSVSEDWSTATILKEDGHLYVMTVYEADDTSITINCNGELHEFYFVR